MRRRAAGAIVGSVMQANTVFLSHSPDETTGLAREVGRRLGPGDCLLLSGPIGAGKTHFARALIQSLLDIAEDVPSPTFTLVQTYDTAAGPLWHADLYRLTDAQEIEELGLTDALSEAICLVEWPDRLGPDAPDTAITLQFAPDPINPEARRIALRWTDPRWNERLAGIGADV